jgi:hypothetical protein
MAWWRACPPPACSCWSTTALSTSTAGAIKPTTPNSGSTRCPLGLGKLYATIGHRAEARAEPSAAIESYRAMEMTFWLPQAEDALAQTG